MKYLFAILLIIWGLLIEWTLLFSRELRFPFLTIITIIALMLGIIKFKINNLIFFISACLWILFSVETIGFVIFFDDDIFERIIVGFIPLILGIGLIISSQPNAKWFHTLTHRIILIPISIFIGIGSYIYNPKTEEINCWYYFKSGNPYKVLFALSPDSNFEVQLSSEELENEVKKEVLQYERQNGYYCPETKVKVITSFGKIISAKILSFRNSEIDKNVTFSHPTKIPLNKVHGELDILKPYKLSLWN